MLEELRNGMSGLRCLAGFSDTCSVFCYLVSKAWMFPGSCVSGPSKCGRPHLRPWQQWSDPISVACEHKGNLPGVRCKNCICHGFFFSWKQLETNLVTLKSFTCCYHCSQWVWARVVPKRPSSEQPLELRALAWSGMLYYVQSHGNLNLAAISASEIASASQPSTPVTRVDLRMGWRLRNLSFIANNSSGLLLTAGWSSSLCFSSPSIEYKTPMESLKAFPPLK